MAVKRILCIVGGMNAGGAETFLMKVYRELNKAKYQMDFAVAITEKGYYDDEIATLGGRIYHVRPKSEGMIKNFISIYRIVKENQYKYVLRTSQHSLSALELFAAWLGGAKVRVFRSSNSNTTSSSKKQLLLHTLCGFMPKLFANVRVAPSTEAAEFMFGRGCIQHGCAQIINNGVDLSAYCYSEVGRQKTRQEFGVSESTLLVGHVGRFNQQKNHLFLLDIFKEITERNKDVRFLIIGKGELEDSIHQKAKIIGISEYIIFAGVRSDIPQMLSAMDVFVFPSLYEGMPNTVIEAQATGLPCVIADTITKEADITGLVQYLSLTVSPRIWAEKALDAICDKRLDTQKDFVAAKYDVGSVTEKFVKLVFGD